MKRYMRLMISSTTLVALLATGPALAADIGATPDEAVARSWSGCYVGASAGYVHGNNDAFDAPFTEGPFAGSGGSWNTTGAPYETIGADDASAIGGFEGGCDFEVPLGGLSLVLGGVGDISVLGLSGEGTSLINADTRTSFDADWVTSLRARIGVASPQLLFYATGGFAAAAIDVRAFDLATSPGLGTMDVSGGGTESGWVVGGGTEWRFAPKWSMSLEYLHFEFDQIVATGPAIFPAEAFPRFESDVDFDTVRVVLKWRM